MWQRFIKLCTISLCLFSLICNGQFTRIFAQPLNQNSVEKNNIPFRLRQTVRLLDESDISRKNIPPRIIQKDDEPDRAIRRYQSFSHDGSYQENQLLTKHGFIPKVRTSTLQKNHPRLSLHETAQQHTLTGGVNEEWIRRFASNSLPSEDHPNAMVIDRFGNVYVTGVSFTSYTGADYYTIKFSQRGDTLWTHRFNGSGNDYDEATALAVDSEGNLYVSGYSFDNMTDYDFATIKYKFDGSVDWIKTYDVQDGSLDVATCISIDSTGNILVGGYSSSPASDNDIVLVKYDNMGNVHWMQVYDGPGHGIDGPQSMTVDADGKTYITGYSTGNGTDLDYITLCYLSTGSISWFDRYTASIIGNDIPTSVVVNPQGDVFVTGFSNQPNSGYDFVTIKYAPSGEKQWIRTHNGSGNGTDIAHDIGFDRTGNVYVTGSSFNDTTSDDFATVAYNSIGEELWTAIHTSVGSYSDGGVRLIVDHRNSKIIVAGYINYYEGGGRDMTTISYTDSGTISWIMQYDGSANDDDYPAAIALDTKGNVYVTGSSEGLYTSFDYLTVKYLTEEQDQWPSRSNNGAGNNWLNAMATDRKGNVYVTGTDSSHFVTIKYDSTGMKEWIAQFGTQKGNATSLALDDSGNVYITGYVSGPSNNYDYATVKYNTAGEEIWSVFYNGTGDRDDRATSIGLNRSGEVYITGSSYGNNTQNDYVTIKYNSQGIEQWVIRYNGSYNNRDSAIGLVLDKSGNVFITGTSVRYGSSYDFVTIKYLENGVEAWQAIYNGTGNGSDFTKAITIDENNNIYVTGRSKGIGTSSDYTTIKYSSMGVIRWISRFNGPGNNIDDPTAIAVDNLDNVYVTGTSYSSTGSANYGTVKYDSNGAECWNLIYNGKGNLNDRATAIKADANGDIYVTGASQVSGSGYDFVTIKYTSGGSLLWITRYNGIANGDDDAKALVIDEDGFLYVAGTSLSYNETKDFLIAKYSIAGSSDQRWPSRNTGPGVSFDIAKTIISDKDQNVFIGGKTLNPYSSEDFSFLKYDPMGSLQWNRTYNSPFNNDDYVASIATDREGNLFAGGTLYSLFFPCDYGLVKYGGNGSRLWDRRYNGPAESYDFASMVAVDESSNVIITGYSASDSSYDYATIKYDPDGFVKWSMRYDGFAGQDDLGYALTLDQSGGVYVTGLSYGDGTGSDYATVKYHNDGSPSWTARYNGNAGGDDRAVAITSDSKKNIYVTGFSAGVDTTYDFATVKYDSGGNELFGVRFSSLDKINEQARAIAVDSSGNIFVAGSCYPVANEDADYLLVKYNEHGIELWSARYNGPGNADDRVSAMILDKRGNVYLTGKSVGPDRSYDYATLKFRTSGELEWSARYSSTSNCNDEAQGLTLDSMGNVYVSGTNKSSDWSVITTIKYSQIPTSVGDEQNQQPRRFELFQNYPNPLNPTTKISFTIGQSSLVTLKIFDVLGREIVTLLQEYKIPGRYTAEWDASAFPSGVYFYRLEAHTVTNEDRKNGRIFIDVRKMLLLK